MPLTGDFGKLDVWAHEIGELGKQSQLRELSERLSVEALILIDEGFEQQREPAGSPWRPKKRPDGKPIGRGKTGLLRQYRATTIRASGFTVSSGRKYGKFFHGGRRGQRRRPIHPGRRLPPNWSGAFHQVCNRFFDSVLRKR